MASQGGPSSRVERNVRTEMQTIERETESLKIDTHKYTNEIYKLRSYYDPAPMVGVHDSPHMSIYSKRIRTSGR